MNIARYAQFFSVPLIPNRKPGNNHSIKACMDIHEFLSDTNREKKSSSDTTSDSVNILKTQPGRIDTAKPIGTEASIEASSDSSGSSSHQTSSSINNSQPCQKNGTRHVVGCAEDDGDAQGGVRQAQGHHHAVQDCGELSKDICWGQKQSQQDYLRQAWEAGYQPVQSIHPQILHRTSYTCW